MSQATLDSKGCSSCFKQPQDANTHSRCCLSRQALRPGPSQREGPERKTFDVNSSISWAGSASPRASLSGVESSAWQGHTPSAGSAPASFGFRWPLASLGLWSDLSSLHGPCPQASLSPHHLSSPLKYISNLPPSPLVRPHGMAFGTCCITRDNP
jgi:hypothetical protein